MKPSRLSLAAILFLLLRAAGPIGVQAGEPRPEEARLKGAVTRLASQEFGGRRGEGAVKSRAFLIEAFQKLGLKPLFEGSFTQEIPGREPGQVLGVNIGVFLEGTDPVLKDQWVVVSAHYDHLGIRGGQLYPGADDNASGVAMMLEVARSLSESPEKPRRSVMFLGFDLEEDGLFGSRYFVEHSPVPLSRISLFITADMIGRALGGVCETDVFVMGTEHAPGLRDWLKTASRGNAVDVDLLGSDILVLDRSDYGPFRSRKVPYLFFSTGENPTYHRPTDRAETINYPKLEAISRVILGVVRQAVTADVSPSWTSPADNPVEEAETVRKVLKSILEHQDRFQIGSAQTTMMRSTVKSLDRIVSERKITPSERTWMVRVARVVLFSIL